MKAASDGRVIPPRPARDAADAMPPERIAAKSANGVLTSAAF
jgi:hypothetical protein